MKRYWVKLKLEVYSYDEDKKRVGAPSIVLEPATNLTPEPVEYITETLTAQAKRLVEAFAAESGEHKEGA